jgi:ribulose-phosphate 3-epimerase
MEIIPAILTNDPQELDKYLKILRDGKKYQRVQVDFIDGQFADNETIHPVQSDLIPYLPLKFDAHLMVRGDNVLFWGKECDQMGYERVYYQVESLVEPDKEYLGLDLDSPLEKLGDLRKLRGVILMSVKAGFSGQEFNDQAMEKIKKLTDLKQEKHFTFEICVDGGIDQQHLKQLAEVGVDSVAVGVARVLSWE